MSSPSSNTYSFYGLFQRFNYVEIPMIQRDYAQGRTDALDVRKGIIDSFYGAYKSRAEELSLDPLNLDFVFGDTLSDINDVKTFYPLDGQQRLTTLFLLHWYSALTNGQFASFKQHFSDTQKSRFIYTVRRNSNDFFDKLISVDDVESLITILQKTTLNKTPIKDYITNQPWFFLSWSNDPTIQSSLTMLDAIHDRFQCAENLYTYLTDILNPLITFQMLELSNFGLSEDLYIKMNARGKPLTAFENTKAKIEQHLKDQSNLYRHFTHSIESVWADFLWQFRNKQTNVFDTQFMNLMRNIIIVTQNIDLSNNIYESNTQVLRDYKNEMTFQRYEEMNLITINNLKLLFIVLDRWSKIFQTSNTSLMSNSYFNEIDYVNMVLSEPLAPLTYEQIIIFYAYVSYIEHNSKSNNMIDENFQSWIRIITNLSRNTIFNRPEDLSRSIRFVKNMLKYSDHSLNVLSQLRRTQISKGPVSITNWMYNDELVEGSFYEQQLREEVLKAQLILKSPEWTTLISKAESHEYFKGQIEFLFDFSGVFEKWKPTMSITWELDSAADIQYRNKFEAYYNSICRIFDSIGVNLSMNEMNHTTSEVNNNTRNPNHIWERALLTKGDYLIPTGRNKSLLSNQDRSFDWKRLLRGSMDGSDNRRFIVKNVLDELEAHIQPLKTLEKMIENSKSDSDIALWRRMLIDEPLCITYCTNRNIRITEESSGDTIFLLKRRQMNGEHVELYSYYVYNRSIRNLVEKSEVLPFTNHRYESMNDRNEAPYILLSSNQTGNQVKSNEIKLKITSTMIRGEFNIKLEIPSQSNQVIEKVSYENLISKIKQIAKQLHGSNN